MDTLDKISEFFNNVDDITNNYIDRVEIEPIRISNTLYLTGFRRTPFSSFATEAHVKEIKSIKVTTLSNEVLMESDNELYIPTVLFSESILNGMFNKFQTFFNNLNSFTHIHLEYKIKDKNMRRCEDIIFPTKKAACKEALAYRKIYEEVKNKCEEYKSNEQGKFVEGHQPTEFELATAAIINEQS